MEKKDWAVADGVDWVNGARVPASRVVSLTDKEAEFDHALGRIKPKGARSSKPANPVAPAGEASDA